MKKIFIVDEHQSSKQNGVGTFIRNLLKCFEGTEHEVNLLSFNADEKEFKIEKTAYYTEYHIPMCGNGSFMNNGSLSLSLLRLYIKDEKDNVFFVNHSPCTLFLKCLRKLFQSSRIIFVIHDQGWCAPLLGDKDRLEEMLYNNHVPKSMKNQRKFIRHYFTEEKRMYNLSDYVVALAYPTAKLLSALYNVPQGKIRIIPNGKNIQPLQYTLVDDEFIRARFGIRKDEFIILYAGRTVESKGIVPLLEAFEELYKKIPNVRLVIAGQVFQLNEFAKITSSSCAHVTYTGLITHEQLAEWYRIADLGILPSYTEQSSYFGIELLAQGCLIIATNGHNMSDMFDPEGAIIVDLRQKTRTFKTELLDAMTKAIRMPAKERNKMKGQARKRALDKYSLSNMREMYLKLIEQLR